MRRYDIGEDDYGMVIATDGVWEFLTSQQVADLTYNVKSGDVQEICDEISDQVRASCRAVSRRRCRPRRRPDAYMPASGCAVGMPLGRVL